MIEMIAILLVGFVAVFWIWFSLVSIWIFDDKTKETTEEVLSKANTVYNYDRNKGDQ